jgi:peptidoglycan hydrolase-like protein with peptidoglycan-binding domain
MGKYYSETLQRGSTGDSVKEWQKVLNEYFKPQGLDLEVDGNFGYKTQLATKKYQTENGLDADGIVGKNTWGKAGYSLTPSSQEFEYKDFNYDDFKYDDFKYGNYQESDVVKDAYNSLNEHLAQKPGEYQSQWQAQLDDTINKIMNREKFSYDLNGDALYQQYKDKYIKQGKMAMGDAIGQASAMTGGYGNSYAQSVGQQAYQAQLENLNDIVPELYQMAYDKYNQEGQDLYNQYAMLGDRESQDYGRHRDSVGDWQNERGYLAGRYDSERDYDYSKYTNERDYARGAYDADRNFAYGVYDSDRSLAYDQYADDKTLSYNEHRNAITDEQWEKEFAEAKRQFDEQMGLKTSSGNSSENTGDNNSPGGNNKPVEQPVTPPAVETKETYADWGASDWLRYFDGIRTSEGQSAAEKELTEFTKKGFIPKQFVSAAARGARGGKMGH